MSRSVSGRFTLRALARSSAVLSQETFSSSLALGVSFTARLAVSRSSRSSEVSSRAAHPVRDRRKTVAAADRRCIQDLGRSGADRWGFSG